VTRRRPHARIPAVLAVSALIGGFLGPSGCLPGLSSAARADDGDDEPTLTAEALLVRGLERWTAQEMRGGLEDLRAVVAKRPDWMVARRALAAAVLRSGDFSRAAAEFEDLAGQTQAQALASGELTADRLPDDVDAEAIFGLAIATHFLGNVREADRLYRAFADIVGPTSADAARAYRRLAELFRDHDVPWGDADAEEAKALAADPGVASAVLFPRFPDPRGLPEVEPYTRPVELTPEHDPPADGFDSLPSLAVWTPIPASTDSTAVEETVALEILVDERGAPAEVTLPNGEELPARLVPAADAVRTWRFTPAVAAGERLAARIVFEVAATLAPAPAPADEAGIYGEAARRAKGAGVGAGTDARGSRRKIRNETADDTDDDTTAPSKSPTDDPAPGESSEDPADDPSSGDTPASSDTPASDAAPEPPDPPAGSGVP